MLKNTVLHTLFFKRKQPWEQGWFCKSIHPTAVHHVRIFCIFRMFCTNVLQRFNQVPIWLWIDDIVDRAVKNPHWNPGCFFIHFYIGLSANGEGRRKIIGIVNNQIIGPKTTKGKPADINSFCNYSAAKLAIKERA